ncbi:hypothetical protein GCM10010440_76950 [Kitasatospora cinereorecta]
MGFHGALGDVQGTGDRVVGGAGGELFEDLALAFGEPVHPVETVSGTLAAGRRGRPLRGLLHFPPILWNVAGFPSGPTAVAAGRPGDFLQDHCQM